MNDLQMAKEREKSFEGEGRAESGGVGWGCGMMGRWRQRVRGGDA